MTDPAPRPGRSDVRRDFADPGRIFRAIRDADAGIEPAADIAEFLYLAVTDSSAKASI